VWFVGSYASNLVDYHVILDLLPTVAKYYFLGKFRTLTKEADAAAAAENGDNGEDEMTTRTVATVTNNGISLSYAQAAILLCLGLQHKTVDKVVEELTLQPNQILALFTKIIKKVSAHTSISHACAV
jgi:N-acetyltransferase 10